MKGDPHSFDRWRNCSAQQSYRLSFWKVAADEINYRRFFDINDLAAIRVEDPEVFQAVHSLMFDLVEAGRSTVCGWTTPTGFTIPPNISNACRAPACRPLETTPALLHRHREDPGGKREAASGWDNRGHHRLRLPGPGERPIRRPASGTALFSACTRHSPDSPPFGEDLVYASKRLILQTSMSGELNVLAGKLDKISEQHRWSRDFTLASLRHVLRGNHRLVSHLSNLYHRSRGASRR